MNKHGVSWLYCSFKHYSDVQYKIVSAQMASTHCLIMFDSDACTQYPWVQVAILDFFWFRFMTSILLSPCWSENYIWLVLSAIFFSQIVLDAALLGRILSADEKKHQGDFSSFFFLLYLPSHLQTQPQKHWKCWKIQGKKTNSMVLLSGFCSTSDSDIRQCLSVQEHKDSNYLQLLTPNKV